MPVPFFDITRQNKPLEKELKAAVSQVINSGRYILGENVTAFEKEFAEYCGTKYAVGVASGTDALLLGLKVAGIGPGDEVITSPFTFMATAEVINYCGATPVFVDIDDKTFNLDISKVSCQISNKTKTIIPVHLYGLACDMKPLMELVAKNKIAVIEDCAQAAGAEYQGKKVGSFGLGAFSFFPTKNLGCFGDGGAITTESEEIVKQLKALRNHGTTKTYHHDLIGYNSRLDEIQAAALRIKLKHLDTYLDKRRQNADLYKKLLKEIPAIQLPSHPATCVHTYNQFTIQVDKRDELVGFLRGKGLSAMVYYPLALHLQMAFTKLRYKIGDLPVTESVQKCVLSLPIFPELLPDEIEQTCSAIKEFFKK
ncbi:transcriptional regulator [Candidatus Saganbacteria bacterium CG08_land_8_20_14_0_20_45_16]|uniref:Transcriptional regulator n=1 Tax=Candidatus Saganbacteria bacterium CG08_land_8_20_14_0_20_45_16 TaxID=2014293 RepID=A0A2H0Y1Q0_UNCSA|nr:MAG: transcriptional regulator [Candidatus Saganbacteria bacterium CG08_land_8_20_14_0_20_45_16]